MITVTETYISKMILNKPLLYLGLTSIPFLEGARQLFSISVLGFSVGTLSLMAAILIVDFFTGLHAAVKEKQVLTSKKGLKTVYKAISYLLTMSAISILEDMVTKNGISFADTILNYFRVGLFSLAFLWEFYSIGENIQRSTGSKPRLFSFLDFITKLLERKIKDKMEDIIDNKKEDEQTKSNDSNIISSETTNNEKFS